MTDLVTRRNEEVAAAFDEIGDRLLLKGESWFKVRAYRDGAAAIRATTEPVERLSSTGRLGDLPQVGKAIVEKTAALLETGAIPLLDRLRDELPAGLLDLLAAGLTPSAARTLYTRYGVDGPASLIGAVQEGRLNADRKLLAAARQAIPMTER